MVPNNVIVTPFIVNCIDCRSVSAQQSFKSAPCYCVFLRTWMWDADELFVTDSDRCRPTKYAVHHVHQIQGGCPAADTGRRRYTGWRVCPGRRHRHGDLLRRAQVRATDWRPHAATSRAPAKSRQPSRLAPSIPARSECGTWQRHPVSDTTFSDQHRPDLHSPQRQRRVQLRRV